MRNNTARMMTAGAAVALVAACAIAPLQGVGYASDAVAEKRRRERLDREHQAAAKAARVAAYKALQEAQRNTIVLEHVHPRWLRNAADVLVAAKYPITAVHLDAMRELGPGQSDGVILQWFEGRFLVKTP